MSDWQERITRETAPAIRVEHQLRYRLAAQLISTSAVWADLGCGTGVAAVAALRSGRPGRAVLVDADPDAVAGAAQELGVASTCQLAGDLTDPVVLERIGDELLKAEGERVVTCFEVVEHLETFVPLLEWSGALARADAATFVLSVPNDAFWSIKNPYHATSWGDGAFEELRLLLPSERTLFRQVSLAGCAFVDWDASPESYDLTVDVGGAPSVATHFVVAFGPRHRELERGVLAAQTDLLAQRRWERQRESNLAVAEATIEAEREQLRIYTAQFDEWRTYIHELERALGRPLSGSGEGTNAGSGAAGGRGNDPASAGDGVSTQQTESSARRS